MCNPPYQKSLDLGFAAFTLHGQRRGGSPIFESNGSLFCFFSSNIIYSLDYAVYSENITYICPNAFEAMAKLMCPLDLHKSMFTSPYLGFP